MYETRWIRCSAALLMGLSLLVGAPKALAAEKSLSQANYEKLSEARDLMNGGNYGQAVNKLNDLLKKSVRR